MALSSRLLTAVCLSSIFATVYGSYVIMIPKQWQLGGRSQVCIVVDDPSAPSGQITLAATATRRSSRFSSSGKPGKPGYEEEEEKEGIIRYLPPTSIQIPPGKVEFCEDLPLSDEDGVYQKSYVSIEGNIAGSYVNLTENVRFQHGLDQRTILQSDKYLYQPGQLVQFRILTHYGPLMNISTETYPEVWVTTPSKTRIAQWKDVENSNGLVHLEMQLADEPEEGTYQIHVKTEERDTVTAFKVEEYVLPRFELTIEPPKYVLATDSSFTFKVCAEYTFGQPVKGNLLVKIDNNGYRKCRIVITKNETISGCQEIEVSSSEIRTLDCNIHSLFIKAKLEEEGTGVQLEKTHSISLSRQAVSFKTLYNDKYMKYNLPYTLKVRAERPDGSPAQHELLELCYDGSCKNITTPPDGIIKVHVTKFSSRRILIKTLITRALMNEASSITDIERYYSASNSALMIHAPEGNIKCVPGQITQHNLQVLFSTPDLTSAKINVQVVSRDRIQYWESANYQLNPSELPFEEAYQMLPIPVSSGSGTTGAINIPLELPHTVAPSGWVLVWYIRDDGEVVSDAREVEMEKCLPISVDLSWSTNEAQPGEQATLSLASEPNSLCSIGVVDKSVELLTPKSNALTVDSFFDGITHYFYPWRYLPQVDDYSYCRDQHSSDRHSSSYYSDYVDALKMFDESGLLTFSDLQLETRPCEKHEYPSHGGGVFEDRIVNGPYSAFSEDVNLESAVVGGTTVEEAIPSEDTSTNPRTDFPETWLWELTVIPPYGEVNQHVSLPDTITEWVGKAVCVNPQKGVGVSQRASIITFTPFFLDLTLPSSIKRGEILPVKISVFNYLDEPLPVTVILEESLEYEILEARTVPQSFCVESNDMMVHTIWIQPTTIGDVNITVSAFVDHHHSSSCGAGSTQVQKRDSMIRSIPVEAEGFPREKTWTKYICSEELSEGQDVLESWEVSAPPDIVEGSDRGWVMVAGDLLALSVQNLGNLIRMPSGCGEQNMVNFAPNIFILQYLDATGQDAPEAKDKLLRFMNKGYQRQLLYLRKDGSFSAFGNADDFGSTWLTAFVLKSLSQAQEYITIDQRTISNTKQWLQQAQNSSKDGCYQSIGTVFNKAMRGGVSEKGSSVPLTAYVMISLLESGEIPTASSLVKATHCLRSHSTQNIYIMALKAYALALAQDVETSQLLKQLLVLATETKTSLHWELPNTSWISRPLEVEIAGYTILAMLTWDPSTYETQARKIVKWISSQRNGQGGFISTQDTVVALQAMASFESHLSRGNLDAVTTVKTTDLMHSFSVDESNKLLQQQVAIPSLPTTVSLDMTGEGCVLMQAVLRYNIPEPEPSDAFSLTVSTRTARDKNCITKRVIACASYLLPDAKSNMAVIEVNLVSGYIPEKADLKKLVKENPKVIKRYEVDGSKVSFYIEEFTAEDICINFRVIRDVNVENVKPGSVVVYDYYQPEFSLSKSYTLPAAEDCLYAY